MASVRSFKLCGSSPCGEVKGVTSHRIEMMDHMLIADDFGADDRTLTLASLCASAEPFGRCFRGEDRGGPVAAASLALQKLKTTWRGLCGANGSRNCQLAIVRKRPFVITEIIPSVPSFSGEAPKANHLIKLSSVEDDGLSEEFQVMWELAVRRGKGGPKRNVIGA